MKFEVIYDSEIGAVKLIFKILDMTYVVPLEDGIIMELFKDYKR
jgi:hypothetical protein